MLITAAIFGAIVGWFLADFESFGLLFGGAIGLGFGWVFRGAVRTEIRAATDVLTARFEARLAAGFEQKVPEAAESAPAPRTVAQRVPVAASIDTPTPLPPEPVRREVQPVIPAEPGMVAQAFTAARDAAKNWIFGGNTIVRIGIIVLFVGLSFLASYAASAGLFPVELRLALVAAVGAALLAVGYRTREQRPGFGLALQGAGVASIYLTLFAAARLVDGFSLTAAFALMILVCALGCALALWQRSQALAATAFAGGFAVPLLLSTGGGDVVALFTYYTLLNVAILFIAGQRSWRVLNLIGFFSTFGVLTLWMADGYQPAQFVATQSFLIVSVLIYVVATILYTRNTAGRLGNAVDTTLLFGPALAGFGLEVALVGDRPFGSAFAALAFAALYIAVAAFTAKRRPESFRVMSEAMLAIGVVFVTLAVPLALGARWTSAAWALEGAGAFWIGMRQARWLPRMFGIALQIVAALIYLVEAGPNVSSLPIANAAFMGAMLIALAVLATAWWLRRDVAHGESRLATLYERVEAKLGQPAFLLGFAFWWAAWVSEAARMLPPLLAGQSPVPVFGPVVQMLLVMLAFVASAWGWQIIGKRTDWRVATWPSYASLVALLLAFLSMTDFNGHILYMPGLFIWIVAIALHSRMLYLNDLDSDASASRFLLTATHVGGVWLATAMIADCLWLAVERGGLWDTSWAAVVFLASVVAVLIVLTLWATRAIGEQGEGHRWPLARHAVAYGWFAAVPIAALVFISAFGTAIFASGRADPLPYVPILNPVDLMLALAIAALALWRRSVLAARPLPSGAAVLCGRGSLVALAALAFVVINTVWLRIAHQLLGVDWDPDRLFDSVVVQTGLAILWMLLALPLMVLAHRRAERALWLVGAGLLGLTVAKLLLVDLNNAGGGARIVAFIAVGVLMLVVGYLAPLPPRTKADEKSAGGGMTRVKQMFAVMAGLVLVAAGPDNDPASYKVRLPLTLATYAPVQRVNVPAQALIALQSADMADLRVFDGRGRTVPIARMPATSIASRRTVLQALPILGSQDALEVSGVSLKLDDQGRARVVSVDGRVADDRSAKVLGVLFDTRGIQGSPERLRLDAVVPAGQPVTFRVEASEDLQNWRLLGERVIYRTPDGGNADGEAVALSGTLLRGTRLRVTWRAESRLLSPVTVRSAVLVTRPEGAAAPLTVGATISALTDPHTIEFAVPFATPVATIAVYPAGNEGLVPVRVLGRNHAEEPWTLLGRGAARPGGAAISLSGQSARTMRIEADRRTDGFRAAPTIRFGFLPIAIAFVASGRPPFILAAGLDDTRKLFLPLSSLTRTTGSTLPEASVRQTAGVQLALQSVIDGGASQRQVILWGVLLAATALLALIAWRIGRATTGRAL